VLTNKELLRFKCAISFLRVMIVQTLSFVKKKKKKKKVICSN